jgi:cation transport regulator ChaB
MPYGSKKDLPKQVQGLPDHAKSIFMAAFNSALKDTKDEERAFKIAWAAVKRKFKKEGDKWVAKDGFESEETIVMDATDESSVFRRIADGFLLAQPRVARTGIQIYRGWEVGKPEMDEVKVYRSEEEVFDQKSLKTFAYRTLTMGHPSEMVSSDNWKETAIGHTGGEVVRDGSTVRVPLLIMDKNAINRINDGVKELSVGYYSDLNWKSGTTPQGEMYDAVQANIRVNHVAVVPRARGGRSLRLGDGDTEGEKRMSRITIDGVDFELEDRDASLIQRAYRKLEDAVKTATDQIAELAKKVTDAEKKIGEQTALVANKDGEIVVLKKQVEDAKLTPAMLDAQVQERQGILSKAMTILGDAFDSKDLTNDAIKKLAVEKALGDAAKSLTDPNMIHGAFTSLTVKAADAPFSDSRPLAQALGSRHQATSDVDKAWEERSNYLANAWKTPMPGARQ